MTILQMLLMLPIFQWTRRVPRKPIREREREWRL